MDYLSQARNVWDKEASSFDEQPDHGMAQPDTKKAWKELLDQWLPKPKAKVADLGCGTGSISVLLARAGHTVVGIDYSPKMIDLARIKAKQSGLTVQFEEMDAAHPTLADGAFDYVVCRHILWTLPEPEEVLKRWAELLTPTGAMFLVEGFWMTGGGLRAKDVVRVLPKEFKAVEVINLGPVQDLWGRKVDDERYAISAKR